MRSVPFSAKFEEMNEKYYKKNIGCLMTIEGLQFHSMGICYFYKQSIYEPRSEKTGLRGFRPGPTQTGLYSHRRWLEA